MREELELLRKTLAEQPAAAVAASAVQVNGQVRTRFEGNDRDFASGSANLLHLLRTRVHVKSTPSPHTRVFIQVQDARLWGEEASTLADGDADHIDFHQAYVQLDQMFSYPLSVRLGRQEITCGSQRLIGAVGWHNFGRSFDAIKVRYGKESYVDLFNAKLDEKGIKDRNFLGIYGHVQVPNQVLEPYMLFEHDKNSLDQRRKRATLGLRAQGEFTATTGHGFGYELEGAFQTGELGAQDVNAWMATGSVSYTSPSWRWHKFSMGADLLSGDDQPADKDYKVFDTLFATNHKFYGFMDFFLNIPADTAQQGLVDLMLKGEMKTAENIKLSLHLHHFSLAEGAQKMLGQEADVILSYRYNEAYSIDWGRLIFVPDNAMKIMKSGNDPAFKAYLQIVAKF